MTLSNQLVPAAKDMIATGNVNEKIPGK